MSQTVAMDRARVRVLDLGVRRRPRFEAHPDGVLVVVPVWHGEDPVVMVWVEPERIGVWPPAACEPVKQAVARMGAWSAPWALAIVLAELAARSTEAVGLLARSRRSLRHERARRTLDAMRDVIRAALAHGVPHELLRPAERQLAEASAEIASPEPRGSAHRAPQARSHGGVM